MIIVADNIHIVNPLVEKAIKEMDPSPIQDLARRCEDAGANIIDINPGPLSRDGDKKMVFLVEAVQEVTNLRLCLDTNNPKALEAGLKACRIKPIINGFSLELKKLDQILPLAVDFQTDIVGFLLFSNGQVPPDSAGRLDVALKLMEKTKKGGLSLEKLIIDPVLVPIIWKDGTYQAKEVLSTLKLLPELLGFPVRTIVGLSNLTSGSSCREKSLLLEEVYLSMLAESGLDMVLLNVFHKRTLDAINICDCITNSRIFSWV